MIDVVYNDLQIIEESGVDAKYYNLVKCKCLVCGDVSDYRKSEVLSGRKKRCSSCNRSKRFIMTPCGSCEIKHPKLKLKLNRRKGLNLCQDCYAKSIVEKCKDCDSFIKITTGQHGGRCSGCNNTFRIAYMLVNSAKSRATKSKIAFDLDIEWVKERLYCCEATGIPFKIRDVTAVCEPRNYSNRDPYTPTIDKINNKLGYTKDNCRVVCWWYNLTKCIWSDEFIKDTISKWFINKEADWQTLLGTKHVQTAEAVTI